MIWKCTRNSLSQRNSLWPDTVLVGSRSPYRLGENRQNSLNIAYCIESNSQPYQFENSKIQKQTNFALFFVKNARKMHYICSETFISAGHCSFKKDSTRARQITDWLWSCSRCKWIEDHQKPEWSWVIFSNLKDQNLRHIELMDLMELNEDLWQDAGWRLFILITEKNLTIFFSLIFLWNQMENATSFASILVTWSSSIFPTESSLWKYEVILIARFWDMEIDLISW